MPKNGDFLVKKHFKIVKIDFFACLLYFRENTRNII
jgi:hypothetical protein